MAISYPLTPPTNNKEARTIWKADQTVVASASPFTMKAQIFEYAGQRWEAEVSLDPMTRADAAPWLAFLAALKGRIGTFRWGPELLKSPLGAGTGTPLVNGGSQSGHTLVTDGWANSTLVLKAGDYFQIGDSLYMVLSDVTSNGSGQASIDIWPHLRGHADNSPLVTTNPKCLMRLVDPEVIVIDAPQTKLFSIGFTTEEAL